jgi:outer membrane murein-binding lipoprotein Lpp
LEHDRQINLDQVQQLEAKISKMSQKHKMTEHDLEEAKSELNEAKTQLKETKHQLKSEIQVAVAVELPGKNTDENTK